MYVIVRYSTDQTWPNYKLDFTTSKKKVEKALEEEIENTYSDPETARNWHSDITEVYEMPYGWRRPTKKYINEVIDRNRGSMYCPNENEVIAKAIFKDGIEIENINDIR